MGPRLTLGLCKGIFVPPFSARPGKFLFTSLAVSIPSWNGMLLPVVSDVDIYGRLRDDP